MIQLTVAHMASLIAAGISLVNQLCPNALAYILSWVLGDINSASTWTVASNALQQSYWPSILRADSAFDNGVRKDILWLVRSITAVSMLLSITAVITPLGLYSKVVAGDAVQAQFVYATDPSPFGYGTPPRSNYSWSRLCGYHVITGLKPCPFSDTVAVTVEFPNGTMSFNYPYGINLTIPEVVLQTYSSGTGHNTTVSNFFDIQWRQYVTSQDDLYNNGSSYLIGAYRSMQSLVLNDATEVVEGLVVDTINGGIGFRNHTVPPGFPHGVRWEEDLLFVEPETVCVDTNLTLDYTIINTNGTAISEVVLTDRGGFVNMDHTFPDLDFSNSQMKPDIHSRAYIAAWLHNAYTALYLNVTNPADTAAGIHAWSYMNSAMNKTFPIGGPSYQLSNTDSLVISQAFNEYFEVMDDASEPGVNTNIFGISSENYTEINSWCSGGFDFSANITNILVGCGLMRGVPQRQDPGTRLVFERDSRWSQKMFACASAVKATIKTVSLTYNRTDGLFQSLEITGIEDKQYTDEMHMPLWGVEQTGNRYDVSDINPIWGLVSPEYQGNPNVSTVRKSSLYLPGQIDNALMAPLGTMNFQENLPGSDFSISVLSATYSVGDSGDVGATDYTGKSSIAMWARWQNLTKKAETASLIPNLIFTDLSAATVVGTKGILGPGNSARENLASVLVRPMRVAIRYKYVYIIPAAISALALVAITCGFLIAAIRGKHGTEKVRLHLQRLSPGRIFTTLLLAGDECGMNMPGKDWSDKYGEKVIDLSDAVQWRQV